MNNLIIDGNYLFFKTMFFFPSKGNKKSLEGEKQQGMFMRKVATDLAYIIRQFKNPGRVICVFDSKTGSWRKKIKNNIQYKSNRVKKDDIDWESFYNLMDKFSEIISNKGFIISRVDNAEGDDLIYLWSKKLLENGENCVAVTGDADLHQIVRLKNNNYAVVFNPNSKQRKLYLPENFPEWYEKETEVDLFDSRTYFNDSKEFIKETYKSVPKECVNVSNFLVRKILTGDPGDNVPSVFVWETGKNTNRITEKRAEKILNFAAEKYNVQFNNLKDLSANIEVLAKSIEFVTKQKVNAEELEKNLKRNIVLMYLHEKIIPKSILTAFEKHFQEYKNQKIKNINFNLNGLLEGSEYLKESNSIELDLFSALDKNNKRNERFPSGNNRI